jgi:plasmid stability protein
MTSQIVTLELPEPLYERLRSRAAQARRSIEAEARETLASAIQGHEDLPADLEAAIAPLALLSDAELWQAGRTRLPQEAADQLAALNLKHQREGLTEAEAATSAALIHQYERVMLIRAQAAALLKQRGHDVSALLTTA